MEENKETIVEIIREYLKTEAFSDRKVTDIPKDDISIVNRRYVTLNGALAARPASSIATVGQRYFETTNNKPIYFTIAGWRDSTGSIVAGHT